MIRTCNLLIRSQVLYPIELRVRMGGYRYATPIRSQPGNHYVCVWLWYPELCRVKKTQKVRKSM
jgi:hypothetical protein